VQPAQQGFDLLGGELAHVTGKSGVGGCEIHVVVGNADCEEARVCHRLRLLG
jgi:hypothetical protein